MPKKSDENGECNALSRRTFLKTTAGVIVAASLPEISFGQQSSSIPYRTLGRTGEKVSLVGLGGFHIGTQKDEQESIRIVRSAIDSGINFMDNCWDYNNGGSEIRMGKALRDGYRKRVFLMTKIDGRDKKTAAQQIDESLRRLQTDVIDLVQHHEIIRMSDPELIFAPGGAQEAVMEAKKAGKIRYVGFTGHKSPEIHLAMLRACEKHGFTPDTVQLPLNVMDAHYDSFEQKVLPELVKRNIGVLGMKPMGGQFILGAKVVTPTECLHYAMNLPTSVVITGIDKPELLDQALKAAGGFRPMSKQEVAGLLRKTQQLAKAGQFERYKTSKHFDGTEHNPQWLGPRGKAAA